MKEKFIVLLEDYEYFVILQNILIKDTPVLFELDFFKKEEIKKTVKKLFEDYNIKIYFTENLFGDLSFLASNFEVKKLKRLNKETEIYKNFKKIDDNEILINKNDIIFGKNKNIEFVKTYSNL